METKETEIAEAASAAPVEADAKAAETVQGGGEAAMPALGVPAPVDEPDDYAPASADYEGDATASALVPDGSGDGSVKKRKGKKLKRKERKPRPVDENGNPIKFVPPPKEEKTPEHWAKVAELQKLRDAESELPPENLPLACVVRVLSYEEVPLAGEQYAMVTVYGPDDQMFRLCVRRGTAQPGDQMLYVDGDAALPIEDRWRDELVTRVKEKVYKFGFGIKIRRLLPHVKRNVYIHNCGVLYPLDDFEKDLKHVRLGEDCAMQLNIDRHSELKLRQNAKKPKPPKPEDELEAAKPKKKPKQPPPPPKKPKASFSFLESVRWFRAAPGKPFKIRHKKEKDY